MNLPDQPVKKSGSAGGLLFYAMLGLILALIAVFLVVRPAPRGGPSSNASSSSAKPTQH